MIQYNRRTFGRRSVELRKAREKYPFRLVRNHSLEPRPENVTPLITGEFARFPAPDGDEWMFSNKIARDMFITKYGGTALGE